MLRVRKSTTTHLAAYMPFPSEDSEEYFDLMEQCSRENHGKGYPRSPARPFAVPFAHTPLQEGFPPHLHCR